MKPKEIEDIIETLRNLLLPVLKGELAYMFESYRYGLKPGGKWCCRQMRTIAADVWHVNSPSRARWETQLTIRGERLCYCPFCGVKL